MKLWWSDKARKAAEEEDRTFLDEWAALEPPADRYRIREDIATGLWQVEAWDRGSPFGALAGHRPIARYLASKEHAERWLDAHLHPEKYAIGYDSEGNRIEVES